VNGLSTTKSKWEATAEEGLFLKPVLVGPFVDRDTLRGKKKSRRKFIVEEGNVIRK